MKSLQLYIDQKINFNTKVNVGDSLSWYPDDNLESLNNHLDKNKFRLRTKYIRFIKFLGNKCVANSNLNKIFKLDQFHNIWHYSLISEKCPIKSPQIANCLKLMCLDEMLTKRKIKKLYLYSSDKKINNSINLLCKRKFIQLKIRKSKFNYSSYTTNKLYNLFKAFYFIIRIGFRYLVFNKRKKNYFKQNHQISIFSYLLNFDIIKLGNQKKFSSKYWGKLPEQIKKKKENINWFHQQVGFESDTKSIKELTSLNSKKEDHHIINNFLTPKMYFYSIYKFIKIITNLKPGKNIQDFFNLKNSKINFWNLLYEDWNNSFSGSHLFYSLIMIQIFDKILLEIPSQKLGLFLYENQAWEKILLSSWKKNSHGTIIGVAHSTIRFWDLRYFSETPITQDNKSKFLGIPNYIAVNGKFAQRALYKGNSSKPRVLKVEALRYFHLNKKDYQKKIRKNEKINKILIIGDIDRVNTKSLISAIDLNNADLKKYNFYFRGHPGALLAKEATRQGFDISNERDIFNDIIKSDLVIVSGSSSVAIEVLILGRPVIVYLNYSQLNMSPASELLGIKFASSPKNLLDLIISCKGKKNIINKNIFWFNNNLDNWNKHLNKFLNAK
tara:strand:+ start:869 stop:2701 length:1833 start_codon:yes stop_codon:yes gene_type:complete